MSEKRAHFTGLLEAKPLDEHLPERAIACLDGASHAKARFGFERRLPQFFVQRVCDPALGSRERWLRTVVREQRRCAETCRWVHNRKTLRGR